MDILFIILPAVGLILGWTIRWLYARFQLSASEQRAERVLQEAKREAEAQKKDMILDAKEQLIRERNQQERENREWRSELQRYERRLTVKEEQLEKRLESTEKHEQRLVERKTALDKREGILSGKEEHYREELERISQLSKDEAKALIIQQMEAEAKRDAQVIINKIESEAKLTAEQDARDILVATMHRIAAETAGDVTVSTVSLPNDEMKGRIIGREGRNIRALETLTGVDVIIDDTPEAVVVSCFDPVRKEIAKTALERLVLDGRIHPARIEEVVQKVTHEIEQKIYEEGEKVLFDLGIHNIHKDAARLLGRLYFRTSYGQNVLYHCKEVAQLCAMIAAQIGANVDHAKRSGLFHDIGKGVETDSDKNHAEVGGEMVRKMNEHPVVVNAVASHHNDIPPASVEAWIVQVADAISAARPGARRESLDNYIKRLENLEAIAEEFEGVEKAYAIQAGRELRIIVNNAKIPDADIKMLGRDIAKKIEDTLNYPGKIRVTLIRETRVIEYAR